MSHKLIRYVGHGGLPFNRGLDAIAEQSSPQSPRGMVFPVSGAPITLEEVEERTRTLPDGATDTEILREKIYRDSAGRMRIEETVK
jgi:hypothetical protein